MEKNVAASQHSFFNENDFAESEIVFKIISDGDAFEKVIERNEMILGPDFCDLEFVAVANEIEEQTLSVREAS